jgi:hypothetical protein
MLCHLFGIRIVTSEMWQPLAMFMANIPYVWVLTPVMFSGAVWGNIIFKFPLGNITLSDKLSDKNAYDKLPDKLFLYGIFVIGFIGLWLMPSLLELVNAIGII